jgi:hypothetical protein
MHGRQGSTSRSGRSIQSLGPNGAFAVIFLSEVIVYPIMALLSVGLLFMHLSLRSKASLVSFLSFSIAAILHSLAAISNYSIHISDLVEIGLSLLFCFAFFITAVTIPVNRATPRKQTWLGVSFPTAIPLQSLYVFAAITMALSLFAALWYRELALEGGNETLGIVAAVIALITLPVSIVLFGIAVRRKMDAKLGA